MNNLLKEIRRVQRRLAVQHFLGILGWCWFGSLLAAAVAVAAARIWPLETVMRIRDWHWLAGFLAAGLIVAVGWTLLTVTPAIRAALEIDRRCGLKERVSSTLAMNDADRQSEAGQALIADADARLRRTAVLEKFPVRSPRHLLLPLVPAAVLLAAMIFWPPAEKKVVAAADPTPSGPPPVEVKKSAEELRQKLAERRKEAEKQGLKDATELLKKLEEGTNELKSQGDREKALVKLNDLARELQERRKQLGGSGDAMKRQMEKIQGIDQGPADKLAKALAKGDFDKAARELEKLQKQLADNKLDQAKKDELAKQIEQLKQKINDLAKQAKDAQTDLRQRANQLKQAGDNAAADKLEDEIQRMQQQGPQMDCLKSLANKLGQCAGQMKQGKGDQAAQTMQQALQQMRRDGPAAERAEDTRRRVADACRRPPADELRQMWRQGLQGVPGRRRGRGDDGHGRRRWRQGRQAGPGPRFGPRRRPPPRGQSRRPLF